MAIKILMPALSPTMTEGTLARWLKNEGDKIEPGEVIAEIETDKATMEVESIDEGVLAKIVVAGGSHNVKVNSLIGIIAEEGEDVKTAAKAFANDNTQSHEASVSQDKKNVIEDTTSSTPDDKNQGVNSNEKRVFISPLAKRIAEKDDIDVSKITGSGPYGRIVKNDVLSATVKRQDTAQQVAPAVNDSNDVKLPVSTMRKVIGQRLLESKTTIPHFYLTIECNVGKLLELRNEINNKFAKMESKTKISVNDMIVKATSYALQDVPEVNASWASDNIIQYSSVDISIAVALEDGLITPIVRNANIKSLSNISNEIKELVQKARSGTLRPEEFQGGGFSISNLGMYGIDNFFAIINPPQSCILAVGSTIEKPIVVDGEISIGKMISFSISCDHRVVDGAIAAKFLGKFRNYIENPLLLCC